MRKLLLGIAALGLAAPASAEMTLGQFLVKANALKAKGMMAVFSKDLKPVMAEMKSASAQLKTEGERRKAAGLPMRTCPPKGTTMTSDELLAMLNAIPPAERGISLKDGLVRVMSAKFPCR
ncbi:hypothetical protein [Sphingomonas lenta]|uniref:Rap1a immunity protein domain-containing protein n=1 Tax=Sphingomonas lenta TaxID=1141887 RepID=A0A2A2SFU0_9SPHN|nr:hypothetical protein [Sphingomonas lenta]PAX08119.1 hypothetical protein CKY28_11070 [Sphingomonas lenta]